MGVVHMLATIIMTAAPPRTWSHIPDILTLAHPLHHHSHRTTVLPSFRTDIRWWDRTLVRIGRITFRLLGAWMASGQFSTPASAERVRMERSAIIRGRSNWPSDMSNRCTWGSSELSILALWRQHSLNPWSALLRPHVCPFCRKSFPQKTSLDIHVRSVQYVDYPLAWCRACWLTFQLVARTRNLSAVITAMLDSPTPPVGINISISSTLIKSPRSLDPSSSWSKSSLPCSFRGRRPGCRSVFMHPVLFACHLERCPVAIELYFALKG